MPADLHFTPVKDQGFQLMSGMSYEILTTFEMPANNDKICIPFPHTWLVIVHLQRIHMVKVYHFTMH